MTTADIADVHEDDVTRVVGLWEVWLCGTVPECDGSVVGAQLKGLQSRDNSSAQQSSSLHVSIITGNSNDDDGHASLEFFRGNVTQSAKVMPTN